MTGDPVRADIYTRITDRIIADLERGVRPWMKPWSAKNAEGRINQPLRVNGERYRGINVLILWSEALANGYTNSVWMTFRQAIELGGHVRRGEHGTVVVFASKFQKVETTDEGEEIARTIPFLRGYTTFNVGQIDGLPDRFYHPTDVHPLPSVERVADAEEFVVNTAADIRHGGIEAFYAPSTDRIQMPMFESFCDAQAYYGVLLHELTHWTSHPSRLARDFGRKRSVDAAYATEELVAEIGSAFVCADLGLALEPREDHAAYIGSWLTALRNDRRMIFVAAGHAQRAADYLHGLQNLGVGGKAMGCLPNPMAQAA